MASRSRRDPDQNRTGRRVGTVPAHQHAGRARAVGALRVLEPVAVDEVVTQLFEEPIRRFTGKGQLGVGEVAAVGMTDPNRLTTLPAVGRRWHDRPGLGHPEHRRRPRRIGWRRAEAPPGPELCGLRGRRHETPEVTGLGRTPGDLVGRSGFFDKVVLGEQPQGLG